MKFFYNFLLLTVLLEITWVALSSGNFEETELKYLAEKLNPTECLRLLENLYLKKPINDEEYTQLETKIPSEDESLLRRQRETPFLSPENCEIKLEEWIHNLPEESSKWARAAMETALRTLGRSDLAQYVKRNRRLVQYFEDVEGNSRNSRNAAKSHKVSHPSIAKNIQATPSGRKFKDPHKEPVSPVYRTPASKALRGKSILEKKGGIQGAHSADSQKIDDDDTRTRWTAFLILLGVIVLTILATVFFALYKKSQGSFFHIGKKNCDDRYPLADRFSKRPPTSDIDIEQGSSTSCSPCGRKKRRGFSTEETSYSPSSFLTREKKVLICKPKKKKFVKEKSNKRFARKCDETCTGVVEKGPASMLKIDKCTRTKNKKCCEKSQCTEPQKPRLDLKTFHDKIANILRKDDNSCKCCKCNAFSEVNDCICLNQTKKNMCTDEKCHKFKLKSIAELCLSSDELSPIKLGEDELNRKKRKKRKKDKDTDMEKECCEKSCTENSARSKDKKELKIKEKKMKKKKSNVEDDCRKKTCLFRKSGIEKTSHLDKNF